LHKLHSNGLISAGQPFDDSLRINLKGSRTPTEAAD
jgi:hypothetical protein